MQPGTLWWPSAPGEVYPAFPIPAQYRNEVEVEEHLLAVERDRATTNGPQQQSHGQSLSPYNPYDTEVGRHLVQVGLALHQWLALQ